MLISISFDSPGGQKPEGRIHWRFLEKMYFLIKDPQDEQAKWFPVSCSPNGSLNYMPQESAKKFFKGILEDLTQPLPLHWSTHHFCVNQTSYCKHPWPLAFLSYKDTPSWTLNRHKGKGALRTSSHCNKIYSFQAPQRSEVHPTTFPEASSSVSHKLPPTIKCHLDPSLLRCDGTQGFLYHVISGMSPGRPQW